jgi:uncharacterized protein YbaR (Trm112 family)
VLLELSELLACPRCGPPQALVVAVDAMEGRRVVEGRLGCPACDGRFPLRSGVVYLDPDGTAVPVSPPALRSGDPEPSEAEAALADRRIEPRDEAASAGETALLIAALLGGGEDSGCLLLGHGLATTASHVGRLAGGMQVVVLEDPDAHARTPRSGSEGVNRIVTGRAKAFPLLDGRFRGAALLGGEEAECREAARVLSPGGRLAILGPSVDVAAMLADLCFEVLAADGRAAVARRV